VIVRLYRALLVAYPRAFRERFGAELQLAFAEGLIAARRAGRRRALTFIGTRFTDAVASGLAERFGRVPAPPAPGRQIMILRLAFDLRTALRQLARQPAFAAIVIGTLALGIGANTAVFSVVDGVLVKPLPYRDPGQLGFLWTKLEWIGVPRAWIAGGHIALLQLESTTISDLVPLRTTEAQLTGVGNPEQIRLGWTSTNFADVLGVQPMLGRSLRREDGLAGSPRVVILGHALWTGKFGADRDVIGRQVAIGGQPHEIAGVFGPDFRFLSPTSLSSAVSPEAWVAGVWDFPAMPTSSYSFALMIRATHDKRLEDVQAELNAIGARLDREQYNSRGFGWALVGMRQNLTGTIAPVLWIVQAAAVLVLLVASANVASLFLVRTAGRRQELALRAALGAGRARLGRQLVLEAMVLSALSAALAVGLAYGAVAVLKAANPAALPGLATVAVDGRVMLVTAAVTMLAGMVFGLLPLLQTRGDLRTPLQHGARTSEGRSTQRLRAAFVTGQIAMALTLVTSAALLVRTFAAIRSVDPGFDAGHTVIARVTLPSMKYPNGTGAAAFFDALVDRLAAIPSVQIAGGTSSPPLSGRASQINVRARNREETRAVVDVISATSGYVRAAGLRLLEGREFTRDDRPAGLEVAIVDDVLAKRLFPGESAINQVIDVEMVKAPVTIVGVVKQAHQYAIHRTDRPQIYRPYTQRPALGLTAVIRTRLDAGAIAPQIRRAVTALDPTQPVADIRTMSSAVDASLLDRRLAMTLVGGFAGAALLLAAVGLYGLMSHMVSQRTREIGIRVALGAQPREVRWMVVRRGAILASIGLAIGLIAAYASRRLLETQLFQVSPTDLSTLAGAAGLLLAVALLASVIPARRAVSIDPVEALRSS
jgi:predicted permease